MRDELEDRVSKDHVAKALFMDEASRTPVKTRRSIPDQNEFRIDSTPVLKEDSAREILPMSVHNLMSEEEDAP